PPSPWRCRRDDRPRPSAAARPSPRPRGPGNPPPISIAPADAFPVRGSAQNIYSIIGIKRREHKAHIGISTKYHPSTRTNARVYPRQPIIDIGARAAPNSGLRGDVVRLTFLP